MSGSGADERAAARSARLSRAFDDRSRGLDRFGLVLALTACSVVGLALVDINGTEYTTVQQLGALLAAAVVGLTLITALRASGLARRRQVFVDVLVLLVVVGYVFSLLGSRTPQGQAGRGVSTILVALSVAAPVVIVMRLVRHRDITLQTILGAISAYLLIGVAYFYVYLAVGGWQGQFFADKQPSSTYMYFSLTTLTTVGYGDFTATTKLGRLLANSEAVIGQVYLVTFVAFIVSLGASAWKNRHDAEVATGAGDDEGPSPRG